MEERLNAAGGELLAEIRAGVATVTLNRPAALNALSLGMIEGLADWLRDWANYDGVRMILLRGAGPKAFCAGGDIRSLHDTFKAGHDVLRFFELEYQLDYHIHTYPKPVVALLDGIVMGGGMGLGQGARLRLVGERTRMAMPETAIGLFPDVGGSYFLSRLEGSLGEYLGLIGPSLNAADAIYAGLADQYIGSSPMAPGELPGFREAIDHHFSLGSVEEIVASLKEKSSSAVWAQKTLDAIAKRSPTMLKVSLEQIRRGRKLSLGDCFRMELELIRGSFEHGDFIEGIRALIVEKDNQPRWNPPTIEEVAPASVARFFGPRWIGAEHPLSGLEETPA